jgi:glycosyltransferase involved in cell wall biosynthesis
VASTLIAISALLVSIIFVFPSIFLFVEVCSACLKRRSKSLLYEEELGKYSTVVVIPAHNEAKGIAATLTSVTDKLGPNDRILVVADNCSDNTAEVARKYKAQVIERNDDTKRGKGFALSFAIDELRSNPPNVVIFMDADCTIDKGSFSVLASKAIKWNRPTQAYYSMASSADSESAQAIARLAWLLKNFVRPNGCLNMGLPCQLMGTGMALPWALISSMELATADLVEDMKLGIDCALVGSPALFAPEVEVKSFFPVNQEGRDIQSSRWQSGHLSMIWRFVLKLFMLGMVRKDVKLIALAADLSIPPFALYLLLHAVGVILAAALFLFGFTPYPFAIVAVSSCLLIASIFLTWICFGTAAAIPASAISSVPRYIMSKLRSYSHMLRKGKVGWVRTKRDSD